MIDAVDSYGRTALHHAASNGHFFAVQSLISRKADVTTTDKRGLTAAQLAGTRGHHELLGLLRGQVKGNYLQEEAAIKSQATVLIVHSKCLEHHTCEPSDRVADCPPENVHRLSVLYAPGTGILHSSEFEDLEW